MNTDETPIEAMYRELQEETGLDGASIEVLGSTAGWLRYRLPHRHVGRRPGPTCIGQKQVWFLLRLLGDEDEVCLDRCGAPEFDRWRWVDYWYPLDHVVHFKRSVYARALSQLAPLAGVPVDPGVKRWLSDRRDGRARAATARRYASGV